MSSRKLLDLDSDDGGDQAEQELPINKAFSERYENYRGKEVMQQLKEKYGDQIWESSADEPEDEEEQEDSSEDVSEPEEEKEFFDENFLRVLGALKSKDADIYDKEKRFFVHGKKDDKPSTSKASTKEGKPKKAEENQKMGLMDYHKKLLKEKMGVTFEDEEMLMGEQQLRLKTGLGYYEELSQIKKELLKVTDEGSEKESDDDLIIGKKVLEPIEEVKKEDPKVILNQKCKEDKYIGKLQTFWTSDKLNENERFLRDYIINKEYLKDSVLEKEDQNAKFSDEERSEAEYDSDDATQRNLVKVYESAKFHHQEPEAQIIKSYPRDIESIRDIALKQKKGDKRSQQVERKKLEKEAELKKLRELKRDEIRKKIQILEKTSGSKLSYKVKNIDIDLLVDDTEFDADKYDEKVAALFNDEFYRDEDAEKPKFEYDSDIDDNEYGDDADAAMIADEDEYMGEILEPEESSDAEINQKDGHKEKEESEEETDEPKLSKKQRLKLNKKEKQQKKLDVASKKNFGIYEDVIGGQGVRFKYRKTSSNTFGLTMEEILFADDEELNRWCSLKKSQQFEDDEQERQYFEKKGDNMALKKKILKSLYGTDQDKQNVQKLRSNKQVEKKKRRKGKKNNKTAESKEQIQTDVADQPNDDITVAKDINLESSTSVKDLKTASLPKEQNKKKKRKRTGGLDQERISAYGINQKNFKKKKVNKG